MPFIIIGGVICVFAVVLMYALIYASGEQSRIEELMETGPFSIATIENVEKKLRKNSDRIRHYYECKVKYMDLYGTERSAIIDLPYHNIPIGGQLKIAYSSEDFTKIYLVEALFMSTPEYIKMMEEKGYERTRHGFIKKGTLLNFEVKDEE
jgi:hypothetical protein